MRTLTTIPMAIKTYRRIRKVRRKQGWFTLVVLVIAIVPFFWHPGGTVTQQFPVALVQSDRAKATGFVVSPDGLLLTSAKALTGAKSVYVVFRDNSTFNATVLFADEKSDIGLLRLSDQSKVPQPVRLGDSSAVTTGDNVLAVPFSAGNYTVQRGSITSTGGGLLKANIPSTPGDAGAPVISTSSNGAIGMIVTNLQGSGAANGGVQTIVPMTEIDHVCSQHGYPIGNSQ